jgi:3-polyprenyl-4-hydroxybenzoate decarboxylase
MAALSDVGAIIAPPVPAFYAKPESIEDMVSHAVGRMLDLFEIDVRQRSPLRRRQGPASPPCQKHGGMAVSVGCAAA